MEVWKPIKQYYGIYEVSNLGRVRRISTGYVMKERLTYDGYVKATLSERGIQRDYRVHRLVAEAFIPNPENKETVNHKDGVKTNNNVDNLEWATRAEQTQHSYDLGLKKPVHTNRKLTEYEVHEIRTTYVKGSKEFGSGALSKKYGITDANILKVVKGLSYSDC